MPCDNKKGTDVVCLPSDSDLCPTGPDAEDAIKQTLSAECCQGASPETCMVLQTLHCGPFSAGAVDPCCFDVTLANDGCATPGRPLVVDELHLKANMTEGSNGWHGPNHDEENVQRPQRHAERAEQWLADGLLEHASVASFTRAALALMQRGAPAALVDGCLLAARQEIGHARDAFSLASAYGGRPVSPGPLPLPPSVSLPDSLTAFALETFAEGCVNETCAAVLAAERLLTETDALAQRALGKVVKEETEHAELSWRMLAWLLEQGGGETEEALRAAAVRLQTEAHQDHTTIDQVVVPCLERLLERGRSTARRHPGRGDSPGLCSP